jgi:hypothetical protein
MLDKGHITKVALERWLKEGKIAEKDRSLVEEVIGVKKSKYRNTKTEYQGIRFDSEKECRRYKELKMLLKAGEIGMLQLQVEYEINPGGAFSMRYVADFVYVTKEGVKIVEDAKGFRTREYLKKRKLMWKVHGIRISEV